MKEGHQKSLKNYIATADILVLAGEHITGQKFPKQLGQTWRLVLAAMRMADYQIDQKLTLDERREFFNKAIGFLDGSSNSFEGEDPLTTDYFSQLRNCLAEYSEDQRSAFTRNSRLYMTVVEARAAANDVTSFARFRRLEGQVASRFFSIFLPQDLEISKRRACNKWFQRVGRAADCVDSFADLKSDYAEGEVRIKPTLRNRVGILVSGVTDGLYVLQHSNFRVYRGIAQATLDTWQNNSHL